VGDGEDGVGFGDDVAASIANFLEVALIPFAATHGTDVEHVLDGVAGGGDDVVLRDSPVMTLSRPLPGSAPGTIRVITRGSLPIAPHLDAFLHVIATITHTRDHIDTVNLSSLSADVHYEQEGVFDARLGAHFDLTVGGSLTDLVLSGELRLNTIGVTVDVTLGVSADGFFIMGDLVLPVAIPLAFTAGALGAAGFMIIVASNYAPALDDDDTGGTLTDPTALDYAKWATGRFLSHPEDAWQPAENASAFGAAFALEDFPTRGNVVGANPVGFVCVLGPTGPVLIAGGHGFALKSPKFTVDAFICDRPLVPDFALAGQVNIEVPGGSASGSAHGTPPAPTPVAPGTSPPTPGGGGDDSIFKGEGKINLYLGPTEQRLELGSPHDPITLVFLKQFGPKGLCQVQFFLDISSVSGTSFGFTAAFGFEFGGHDDLAQFALHIDLEVYGIFGNAPFSFEGRWAVAFDVRFRFLFLRLGIVATAMAVGFADPKKVIFDLAIDIELPWPLPAIDFHTNVEVLNDPLPPAFNPPMLVGAYEVGRDG
jgi:hypothetical protein